MSSKLTSTGLWFERGELRQGRGKHSRACADKCLVHAVFEKYLSLQVLALCQCTYDSWVQSWDSSPGCVWLWTQQVEQLCEVQLPAAGELPRCRCLAHVTPGQDNVGQAWEKGQCMAYTWPENTLYDVVNICHNYIFCFWHYCILCILGLDSSALLPHCWLLTILQSCQTSAADWETTGTYSELSAVDWPWTGQTEPWQR